MNFADRLRVKSDAAAGKFAEEFAEKMRPELWAEAEKGFTEYVVTFSNTDINSDNLHLFEHPYFVKKTEDILEGVQVIVSVSGFYTKVRFHWGSGSLYDMPINE